MNNRNFTRVNYSVGASVHFGSDVVMCNTANLSIHGMYLKTEQDLPLNIPVHVTVHKSNHTSFMVQAEIVRKEANGVGLLIHDLSAHSFAQLRDIVSENSTDYGEIVKETLSMLACIH
jgi:hypothetical protein